MNNINPLLTPAMQAYLIALIYRNTRTSCLSLAALCSSVSHDGLNRCLHSSFPWSRRLWELFASRMIHQGGCLVLDDTTWQRQTKRSEAVAKVWASSTGGVRLGMQVVLLIWTDGKCKCSVNSQLRGTAFKERLSSACHFASPHRSRSILPSPGAPMMRHSGRR